MIRQICLFELLFAIVLMSSCNEDDPTKKEELIITVQTQNMNFTVNENPDKGQVIGTVSGTTNKGSVAFSIIEQIPSNSFIINTTTGELMVSDTAIYDFESLKEITGKIEVSNGDISQENEIVISINDLEEDIHYGDVFLKNQEEVDDFGAGSYREVNGTIEIQNSNNSGTPITDLSGLNTIKIVKGDLVISKNNSLETLEGLNNILSVEKCVIWNNPILQDINALQNISLLSSIVVEFNPLIKNLNCFSKINSLSGFCSIIENNSLTDLQGLNNITLIEGILYISQNQGLNSMVGLNSLKTINDYLYIGSNDTLKNLNGLENLISIGGSLSILTNRNLLEIDALKKVTSIEGVISINNNPKLHSLSGYFGLKKVDKLSISFNDSLQDLEGLDSLSSVTEGITIGNNKSLTDFCSLVSLMKNDLPTSAYIVAENLYNPTIDDIRNGNCSQ